LIEDVYDRVLAAVNRWGWTYVAVVSRCFLFPNGWVLISGRAGL